MPASQLPFRARAHPRRESEAFAPWKAHEARWPGMTAAVRLVATNSPGVPSCLVPMARDLFVVKYVKLS
jgi:hypothetical protein